MRKSCGKTVRLTLLACARFGQLATTNVSRILSTVGKSLYFAQSFQQVVRPLMHGNFMEFVSVRAGLIPTIPSTYKNNDKRIYTYFITYKGAPS